jgi:guanosine-3',5'-bis(diphosphate) 3'-pyrophosphohydrolase
MRNSSLQQPSQGIEYPVVQVQTSGGRNENPVSAPVLTIQQPLGGSTTPVRTSQPSSIFIVETAPRDLLSNLFFCLDFACRKHSLQRRKDPQQTPYINHPIGVANILVNEGQVCDPEILQAAVLHDTLEDTDTTGEELRTHFGTKVASIVEELTDDKSLSKDMRKLMQIQNGSKKSYGAQVVAMADKIYNLRDLTRVSPAGWTEIRRFEYILWAQEVVRNYYGANESLAKILKDIFAQWSVLS